MVTKTPPLDLVAELKVAEADLSAVHTRIGAGDLTVTVSDLQHAEGTVRFARVRLDAAIETDTQQHEQAELARVAKIRAHLPVIFDTSLLDAAHQALVEALDAYCREAEAIERGVAEVYNELIRIPLSGISVESSAWNGVAIDGHRKPHFDHQVANAVAAAFRRHNLPNDQGG